MKFTTERVTPGSLASIYTLNKEVGFNQTRDRSKWRVKQKSYPRLGLWWEAYQTPESWFWFQIVLLTLEWRAKDGSLGDPQSWIYHGWSNQRGKTRSPGRNSRAENWNEIVVGLLLLMITHPCRKKYEPLLSFWNSLFRQDFLGKEIGLGLYPGADAVCHSILSVWSWLWQSKCLRGWKLSAARRPMFIIWLCEARLRSSVACGRSISRSILSNRPMNHLVQIENLTPFMDTFDQHVRTGTTWYTKPPIWPICLHLCPRGRQFKYVWTCLNFWHLCLLRKRFSSTNKRPST